MPGKLQGIEFHSFHQEVQQINFILWSNPEHKTRINYNNSDFTLHLTLTLTL